MFQKVILDKCDLLYKMKSNKNKKLTEDIIIALGKTRDRKAFKYLENIVTQSHEETLRLRAVSALGTIKNEKGVPLLIQATISGNDEMKLYGTLALYNYTWDDINEFIIKQAEHGNKWAVMILLFHTNKMQIKGTDNINIDKIEPGVLSIENEMKYLIKAYWGDNNTLNKVIEIIYIMRGRYRYELEPFYRKLFNRLPKEFQIYEFDKGNAYRKLQITRIKEWMLKYGDNLVWDNNSNKYFLKK